MAERYREEVFNVLLAQLLQDRGVISVPESVLQRPLEKRRMPDILVIYQGLRTIIEGKVADQADARNSALGAARNRVEEGIAHIGIALVYPAELRGVEFKRLLDELARSRMDIAMVTESGESGFVTGGLDELEQALRNTYEELARENVVAEATAVLGEAVEKFAGAIAGKKGVVERAAEILEIRGLPQTEEKGEEESEEK